MTQSHGSQISYKMRGKEPDWGWHHRSTDYCRLCRASRIDRAMSTGVRNEDAEHREAA